MSGPKHLWSGDWERDSERAKGQRGQMPPMPAMPEPEPEPEAGSQGRLSRRAITYFAISLVVVLGAGIALASVIGGGNPHHAKNGSTNKYWTVLTAPPKVGGPSGGAAVQAPAPQAVSGPSANWLGMQIVTSPSGVVVSAVRLGSEGDTAGFQPGDVLDSINGQQINTVNDIGDITSKLAVGGAVQAEVNRGSTIVALAFAMRDRPTIKP